MKLLGIIYKGPEMDDMGTFNALPPELKMFLKQANGLIAFKGGLHIRGCCKEPKWHSIDEVWSGKNAFWKNYTDILDIDIPFAQDCVGDQFLLRNRKVIKLSCETGEINELQMNLVEFFDEMEKDPIFFLGMHPLVQFEMEGNEFEPGQLLNPYPPFCLNPTDEVTITKLPVQERLALLADVSKKFRKMQEGDDIQFIVG